MEIEGVGADAGVGREPGRLRLTARVSYERGTPARESYWFDVPERAGELGAERGDAWLVALLPLAVTLGEPLRVALPVDARLERGALHLMDIWASWYPPLRPVPLEVDVDRAPLAGDRAVSAFFSGGVDSTFTAVRRRSEAVDGRGCVSELVGVHGFDIPISAVEAFDRFRCVATRTASRLDLRFDHVATNLRTTRWSEAPWGKLAHGCALGAVALLLQSVHRAVLIAATGGYRDLHPWGSHPLTDPLLSTSATAILHDGASFTRVEKLRALAAASAIDGLRVCWESESDRNCGRCMKCLQAMIVLELLGVLDRAPSFPDAVDVRQVRRLECRHSWDHREMTDLRLLAAEAGRADLARALASAVRRSKRRAGLEALRRRAGSLVTRRGPNPA